MASMVDLTAREVREACRMDRLDVPSCGLAPGHMQANLVVLPREYALDFLLFCQRNPKPCPLLEVLDPGQFSPTDMAPDSDVRTDLSRYRVFRDGILVEEINNITELWRDDLVTFLLGCSFSFEEAMLAEKIPLRHLQENKNVPMYNTTIPCKSAGCFSGNLVVSMRPMRPSDAIKAVTLTNRFPLAHGAPVHFGDPSAIGISDLDSPDHGDAVTVRAGEVPVFWACGVTPLAVVMASRPSFCITHSPGRMYVLDARNEDFAK